MSVVMTEPPRVQATSSGSILSGSTDLFAMLGIGETAAASTEAATPETYVLCAVLNDASSTHVRLGSAKYYPVSRVYKMTEGSSVVIKQSSRSAEDGLYRENGTVYAIFTEAEFAARPSKPAAPVATSVLSSPLTVPLAIPVPKVPAAAPRIRGDTAPIGCSAHERTKTVVVAGSFEGSTDRLRVAMKQSAEIAIKASLHGNRVMYAFMGNVVPDITSGETTDSLTEILNMKDAGITLNGSLSVPPGDVILLAGMRELQWLRISNPSRESMEITTFDDPQAETVLFRKTPFSNSKGIAFYPEWVAHNESLKLFPEGLEPNMMAVAMMLKLASVANTMNSPGIVRSFTRILRNKGTGDSVSFISLTDFLEDYSGNIEEGMNKLFDGQQLTPEGLGLMPAAKDVVAEVLEYASTKVNAYLRGSCLVHCVTNEDTEEGAGGLWLTPNGTHDGRVVGKVPIAVDHESLKLKWKKAGDSKISWQNEFNTKFHDFHDKFAEGVVDSNAYEVYLALSLASHSDALPVQNLRRDSSSSCQGVTCCTSKPFGTLKRRILVDGNKVGGNESELISVLEKWSNPNTDRYSPSTFWTVASWCEGTKLDLIDSPMIPINRSEKMSKLLFDVSVTLFTMLNTMVGEKPLSEYGLDNLNGVVGPVVHSQRQAMRLLSFENRVAGASFAVLLPEAFVQYSLDAYNFDYEVAAHTDAPLMAVEGFAALPDDFVVELDVPSISEAEVIALRSELGNRVWNLASETSLSKSAIASMEAPDTLNKEISSVGMTVFHARQVDTDPLAGLDVSLVRAGDLDLVTLDTDVTEYQSLFRVVAK